MDPDSQEANQCVFYLSENLAKGASRTGALPTNSNLRGKAKFIGAYAYKKPNNTPITQDNRIIQTRENKNNADPKTFSIEMDMIIDKQNTGICFGARDKSNFLMWQINTEQGTTRVRPHVQRNGAWVQSTDYNVANAIGYAGNELIGKKIHIKIVVNNGQTVDTYFNGSNTSAFTYNIPTQLTGEFTLGKLMFRQNIDYDWQSEEIARYDNIVVRDKDEEILFEETFDDPSDTGFDGGVVVGGMLKVGLEQTGGGNPNAIDPHAIINLTDSVVLNTDNRTGTLNWTAPNDGDYVLMYYWQQGTAQQSQPAVEPAYCINYFDERGLEALKKYWQEHVLNDPVLNEKIKNGNVQLFMDSLEFDSGRGIANWTENFAEEFEARKGYDITPYLMLNIGLPSLWAWDEQSNIRGTYSLTDQELGQRIMNDFFDVQTELYMENMMKPFKEWLNSYGITLRAQISYGKYLEISEPIQAVDFPEAENRNQRNQPDLYRLWSGGSHLQNKVLSSETGGLDNSQYSYTYDRSLQEAYTQYSVGYSRMIWHIWAAQYGPDNASGNALNWPGYEGGMANFYKWGLREPSFSEYAEFNNHLGRVQQLLREGKGGVDIGMPYMKYGQHVVYSTGKGDWLLNHDSMFFPSVELQNNGYSYDYFSPDFLMAKDVTFNTETQTLELAGYKAIVLWQDVLTLEGAKAILNYAKKGLKVVAVDGAAVKSPYNDGNDEALAAVMAEMKTLPTVKTAASADDVYEALQEMNINPYAAFENENRQLLTQVRRDGDNRYLYLYNYCDESQHDSDDTSHGTNIQTEIAMDGMFIPYHIDAWSGEVSQLANYRHENGRTVFPISLDYGDVALYAFEAVNESDDNFHIVSTDMDSAYVSGNQIVVRGTESGTYHTQLSNGHTAEHTIDVPQAYDITGWNLRVESWTPGEKMSRTETLPGSSLTTTEYAVTTKKTDINVTLDTLTTWDNIPDVGKKISGKGYYCSTFNWDGTADGAYLNFGNLVQSMQVFINNKKTTDINMISPVVDISDLLVTGENKIEIVYSSNLTNVQISRGIVHEGSRPNNFVGYEVYYNSYGPAQATIIPYVEETVSFAEYTAVIVDDALQPIDPQQVTLDAPFKVMIQTPGNFLNVKFINENGGSIGKTLLSKTVNEDGTITWLISMSAGTVGQSRTLKLYAQPTVGGYADTGETLVFDVVKQEPAPSPTAEVISAQWVKKGTETSVLINEEFMIKVVTTADVTKVSLKNETGGSIGQISKTVTTNGDGNKEWLITIKIGSTGNPRTVTAYGYSPTDGDLDGQSFQFVITK